MNHFDIQEWVFVCVRETARWTDTGRKNMCGHVFAHVCVVRTCPHTLPHAVPLTSTPCQPSFDQVWLIYLTRVRTCVCLYSMSVWVQKQTDGMGIYAYISLCVCVSTRASGSEAGRMAQCSPTFCRGNRGATVLARPAGMKLAAEKGRGGSGRNL